MFPFDMLELSGPAFKDAGFVQCVYDARRPRRWKVQPVDEETANWLSVQKVWVAVSCIYIDLPRILRAALVEPRCGCLAVCDQASQKQITIDTCSFFLCEHFLQASTRVNSAHTAE